MKKVSTITVPAAARRLGFTLKYVYDLVYSGKLKARKVAGRWQIPASEIELLVSKQAR